MLTSPHEKLVTVQVEAIGPDACHVFSNDLEGFREVLGVAGFDPILIKKGLEHYCRAQLGKQLRAGWIGSGSKLDLAVAGFDGRRIVAIEHFRLAPSKESSVAATHAGHRLAEFISRWLKPRALPLTDIG